MTSSRLELAFDAAAPAPPDDETVRAIVDMLDAPNDRRSWPAAGSAAAGATDELVALAERLAVPVLAAWRRPDVFPNDHPQLPGHATGYGAPIDRARTRSLAADALLVIGCRLNEVASFEYAIPAPTTRWAHVDLEPRTAHAGLSAPDYPLAADARHSSSGRSSSPATHSAHGRRWPIERAAYVAATTIPRACVGRARRAPGPGRRRHAVRARRRRHRDDGRGQLRVVAGALLQVRPQPGPARAHVRRDGLRPAGGHRRDRSPHPIARSSPCAATAAWR